MPKRIVHGEGVWESSKIAKLPAEIRPEYTWLLPLALANGVFEASARRVWAKAYCFNRPEITIEKAEEILSELERTKLLFRWNEGDKLWGYWIGIEKPGRLPSPSRQEKKHETTGPEPPKDALAQFLNTNGEPMANQRLTNGEVGFGSGFGSGTGKTFVAEKISATGPQVVQTLRNVEHENAVREVWNYYAKKLNRSPLYVFDEERKRKGLNALKQCLSAAKDGKLENAVELMKMAVDRLAESAYHNGDNDNSKKYLDWSDHLFKNPKKLAFWLEDHNDISRSKVNGRVHA